jgi:hypothetical protein
MLSIKLLKEGMRIPNLVEIGDKLEIGFEKNTKG